MPDDILRLNFLYVKDTDEKVYILSAEQTFYENRNEIKIIATIRFLSENPNERALKRVGAVGVPDDALPLMYIGHPAPQMPTKYVWTATVDVKKHLSAIPFGTKAAEVLFGKK